MKHKMMAAMKHKMMAAFLLLGLSAATPAQALTEAEAAAETHIAGLKLAPVPAGLAGRGLHIAYVPQTVSPGGGRYTCGALSEQQAGFAAASAAAALQRIPASAWPSVGLKYLLLCSDAQAGGRSIGGIPVPPLGLLMLATGDNPATDSRFAYTVLHELYHMVEMQKGAYSDAGWDAKYKGYDNGYGAAAGGTQFGSGGAGFINGYGRSFAHEERAEIYAIDTLAPEVLQQYIDQSRDAVLQAKRDDIRRKSRDVLRLR